MQEVMNRRKDAIMHLRYFEACTIDEENTGMKENRQKNNKGMLVF